MRVFDYGEKEVGVWEMAVTVSSMIIGIGILTLPRLIAKESQSSDGWISIVLAGAFACGFAWVLGKLAQLTYEHGLFQFISSLVGKWTAKLIMVVVAVHFMMFCAYDVRAISNISKQYLFERTPVEFIALAFLLVVTYAVSGSRIGLLRLNTLFFPIVMIIGLCVLIFSSSSFRYQNLQPLFVTDFKHIMICAREAMFSLMGFETVLFYVIFMKNPRHAPKAGVLGVIMAVCLYLLIYLVCVGVFSQQGVKEINYPFIELAKDVKVPGEFFERFESIFFTIWIMTIFNTITMAFDISIFALNCVIKISRRKLFIFIANPFIYMSAIFAKNPTQFALFGKILGYVGLTFVVGVPVLLYFLAVSRGVKADA